MKHRIVRVFIIISVLSSLGFVTFYVYLRVHRPALPSYPHIDRQLNIQVDNTTFVQRFQTSDSEATIREFYQTTMDKYNWILVQPNRLLYTSRYNNKHEIRIYIEDYTTFRIVSVGILMSKSVDRDP